MAKTDVQMGKHMKVRHETQKPFACDLCDFSTTSTINLNWHKEAMHSMKRSSQHNYHHKQKSSNVVKLCPFWLGGFCRYPDHQCRYSHKPANWCKFQMECKAWPECRFIHEEEMPTKPCYYQENCNDFNCPFEHLNRNDDRFLGVGQLEMNVRNFPPLGQLRNKHGQNNHMRQ